MMMMFGQTWLWQNHSPALTWPAASSASGCSGCPPTKHTDSFFGLLQITDELLSILMFTHHVTKLIVRHLWAAVNAAAQETVPTCPWDNRWPRRISWNLSKLWYMCSDGRKEQNQRWKQRRHASHLGQLTEGVQDVLLDLQLMLHQLWGQAVLRLAAHFHHLPVKKERKGCQKSQCTSQSSYWLFPDSFRPQISHSHNY